MDGRETLEKVTELQPETQTQMQISETPETQDSKKESPDTPETRGSPEYDR